MLGIEMHELAVLGYPRQGRMFGIGFVHQHDEFIRVEIMPLQALQIIFKKSVDWTAGHIDFPLAWIQFIEIDFLFRDILYEAAQNPILKEISDFLYHLTLRVHLLTFNKGNFSRLTPLFLNEMKEFQKVFANGNVEEAGQIRRRYLKEYLEDVKSLF